MAEMISNLVHSKESLESILQVRKLNNLKPFTNQYPGVYIDDLVDNFESPVKHYDQVDDALTVLRESLAQAEDDSVVIVSLGFLHNIAQLLRSSPDNISDLSGSELVRKKVSFASLKFT